MGNCAGAIHSPAPRGDLVTAAEPEPVRNQNNYRITEEDRIGLGSLKQKCRANLEAIELLKFWSTNSGSQPTRKNEHWSATSVGADCPRSLIPATSSGRRNANGWNPC